ncbi:MAG TPA: hypothetical protein VJP78_08625 [Thermoleophilia bacterium]|nr:hypothetical protein [Thermoleophilia bacterium]
MEQKLIDLPFVNTGTNRATARRAVKMAVPRCDPCQGTGRLNWWEDCPHKPYHVRRQTLVESPVIKCSRCDEVLPDDTLEHCGGQDFEIVEIKRKPQIEVTINTAQAVVDDAVNSGQQVDIMRRKGWKLPQELGISPMCQLSRCYRPNPRVRTNFGDYCSELHAKLVALYLEGESVEIFNQRKMRKQIQSINI